MDCHNSVALCAGLFRPWPSLLVVAGKPTASSCPGSSGGRQESNRFITSQYSRAKRAVLFPIELIVVALVLGCSGSGGSSAPAQTPGGNQSTDNAPVITRVGAATIDVALGSNYQDEGATAEDDIDGDVTADIIIGGDTVDTAVEGSYLVTYNVTDSANNAATQITRTVIVFASDWPMSTPEEQSMNSATLNGVMDFIEQASLDVESLIVIRHGYIVLEEYPDPEYDRDSMHIVHSITKSFVSALIGIAIQQGHIAGVDQKMVDLFPDRNVGNLDGGKQDVTLEDILTMTAGMEWAEWAEPYVDCSNDYINALWCQGDPVQHILDLPMSEQPGTRWNYNGGTSHLLSALVAGFSGTNDTLDFAREFLFLPMGITVSDWEFDGTEIIRQGGGGLWLRPRDMAKFGYLYLHDGNWEGEQIIPAAFVADSVSTHSYFDQSSGYGYQSWWTLPEAGVYYAAGLNGQKIYVVPDLDLVVVFTAYLPDGTDDVQTPMLFDYIMAACDP